MHHHVVVTWCTSYYNTDNTMQRLKIEQLMRPIRSRLSLIIRIDIIIPRLLYNFCVAGAEDVWWVNQEILGGVGNGCIGTISNILVDHPSFYYLLPPLCCFALLTTKSMEVAEIEPTKKWLLQCISLLVRL